VSATILEVLAAQLLDEASDALVDPPARQFVAHGEPAWDCSQLTVHLVNVHPKLFLEQSSAKCAVVPIAVFRIELVGCVAGPDNKGNPPKATTLNDESLDLLNQAWRLWKTLTRRWREGAFGDCKQVNWLPLVPAEPQGLMAGWVMDVEIELTGYHPAEGEGS
jgi:hypothetical protein